MSDPAFALMATHKCSIYSPPPVEGGRRGEPVLYLVDLPCLPLDYVNAETTNRLGLAGAIKLRQTFMEGQHTIPMGSFLTLDDKPQRYSIRATEPWDWQGTSAADQYTHLVLEAPQA